MKVDNPKKGHHTIPLQNYWKRRKNEPDNNFNVKNTGRFTQK